MRTLRFVGLVLLLGLGSGQAWAQDGTITDMDARRRPDYADSLRRAGWAALEQARPRRDTLWLKALEHLASVYQRLGTAYQDSCWKYADWLESEAVALRHSRYEARAYLMKEIYHKARRNFPRALAANYQALRVCEEQPTARPYLWQVRMNFGQIHYELREYDAAIGQFQRAVTLLSERRDVTPRFRKRYLGYLFTQLGDCYEHTGDLPQSETYQRRALTEIREAGSRLNEAHQLNRLAEWYLKHQQPARCLQFARESTELFGALGERLAQGDARCVMADAYLALGEPDRALAEAEAVVQSAETRRSPTLRREAYGILWKIQKVRNRPAEALGAFETYAFVYDSLLRAKNLEAVAALRNQYEVQLVQQAAAQDKLRLQTEQQARLQSLAQQAELAELRSRAERQQMQRQLQQETWNRRWLGQQARAQRVLAERNQSRQLGEIRRLKVRELEQQLVLQRRTRNFLLAGLGVLGLCGLLLLRYSRLLRRRNHELRTSHRQIQAALRSQMNPHFIFNCLNSIKLYALENDVATSTAYLNRFSRLIRLVLENSRSERVTLANELEALRLYIELEALRFKNKLRYEFRIDPAIDTEYLDIPPLLLQPYVENAIWHGLMHKPEGGTVVVSVELPEESWLHVTIADDGIGREAAAALKTQTGSRHRSFGMEMTQERLGLLDREARSQTRVEIRDLVDADGQAAGTEVVLQIPV